MKPGYMRHAREVLETAIPRASFREALGVYRMARHGFIIFRCTFSR